MSAVGGVGAVKAQWVAEVLLELLRSGMARPDFLIETLVQVPVGSHRTFLQTLQKALVRPAFQQIQPGAHKSPTSLDIPTHGGISAADGGINDR